MRVVDQDLVQRSAREGERDAFAREAGRTPFEVLDLYGRSRAVGVQPLLVGGSLEVSWLGALRARLTPGSSVRAH